MRTKDKKNELEFGMWIESSDCQKHVQGYLEQNKVTLEDLSQLNFKVYGALKRAQFDYIHQIFLMSALKLSEITGISVDTANNVHVQIIDYLKNHKDEILRYYSIHQTKENNDDVSDLEDKNEPLLKNSEEQEEEFQCVEINGENFYDIHREKVIEFVQANDIPIEKMFSSRLCFYLSSRYKNLSDLIFTDENALCVDCRLSLYYAEKVLNKVRKYLEQHHTLIVAYCNGDIDAVNGVSNTTASASDQKSEAALIVPLSKKETIKTEYYVVDNQSVSVFDLMHAEQYRIKIMEFAKANDLSFVQIGLSNRSNNCLHRGGYSSLSEIIFETEESLSKIRNMGRTSIEEVTNVIKNYLLQYQDRIAAYCTGDESALGMHVEVEKADPSMPSVFELIKKQEYREVIVDFVRANDRSVIALDLSVRARNCLQREGYEKLSDFVLETEDSLKSIRNLGANSLTEILLAIKEYLLKYENQIIAYCNGDTSSMFDDEVLKEKVLDVFKKLAFSGLHYPEILETLNLPDGIAESKIKNIIGQLIAEHQLEYVDYKCYRTYSSFEKFLTESATLTERERIYTIRKLNGETLEAIAKSENITRERVRQVIKKAVEKVYAQYLAKTGLELFDDDYYQHFYTTYDVDKSICLEWLGIPEKTYNYISMFNRRGSEDIKDAIDDPDIDVGFKLKITNYLNRNKIYVDGNWIEKKRALIEDVVLAKFCKDEVSFDDFCNIYNKFLEEQGIPFDKEIYYTDEVVESRYNRLSEARCVLWKQFQMLRYYDIDGQDYTDLLETLNLDGYENTEVSTLKLIEDNPELMRRYDIRDQYELHNLLRKIVSEGSYHGFKCGRMPVLEFGEFDRDAALFELLVNNAPISLEKLADVVHDEYGYDRNTVMMNYLKPFNAYYHQGLYRVDQKVMPESHMAILKSALKDDFYFIDEIKKIYTDLVADADVANINPFNLKVMGFVVLSRYVIQNYSSLDAYFTHLLTEKELIDITTYKKRYCYVQMWSSKLTSLKNSYEIIEFEPNQIVQFSRLEKAGITKQALQDFCDEVYEYIADGTYFSAKSLRLAGFKSQLYDLGFSDWFYASVLCADERFSFNNMYKNLILYKGTTPISINSFVYDYVKQVGSIDTYDLMNILENEYGCKLSDRNIFMRGIDGINLYHDSILQRLYLNEELFYKELDNDQESM